MTSQPHLPIHIENNFPTLLDVALPLTQIQYAHGSTNTELLQEVQPTETKSAIHLPNELWIDIIERLEQSDRVRCSRACRHLYNVAKPIIYSTVDTASNYYGSLYTLQCLFTTIIENPTLARHVKHAKFAFHASCNSGSLTPVDLPILTAKDRVWVRQKVVALVKNESIADDWTSRIFGFSNYDAVVAFLFQMFSCTLETVTMVDYGACPGGYKFLDIVLQQSKIQEDLGNISYPLSRLHTVEFLSGPVDHSSRRRKLSILSRDLEGYLRLRSVKSVKGGANLAFCDNNSPYAQYPTKFFEINDLYSWEPRIARSFFKQFRDLKTLIWTSTDAKDHSQYFHEIVALDSLKTSLEKLVLDHNTASRLTCISSPEHLDHLSQYEVLKDLVLPASVLGQVDHSGYNPGSVSLLLSGLPTSLEALTLTGCQSEILECLPAIFDYKT